MCLRGPSLRFIHFFKRRVILTIFSEGVTWGLISVCLALTRLGTRGLLCSRDLLLSLLPPACCAPGDFLSTVMDRGGFRHPCLPFLLMPPIPCVFPASFLAPLSLPPLSFLPSSLSLLLLPSSPFHSSPTLFTFSFFLFSHFAPPHF